MAAAVMVLVAGCAQPEVPSDSRPVVQRGSITVDGRQRTYRVFFPPTSRGRGPVPLVLVLHDAGGSADSIAEVTQFDRRASAGGFIAVYPEGEAGLWNAGFCCGGAEKTGIDEVAYIERLLERLESEYPLEPDRVYVTGVSNGAILAYMLGCELSERIAGVASVAGAMLLEGCLPSEGVSVMEIHGTKDQLVPFEGGELPSLAQATRPVPSSHATVARWAELNGCSGPATTGRRGPVTRTTWSRCRGGAKVGLIGIRGAGHTWYAPEFGPIDGAVDATQEIVDFFELHGG